ncbi:glucose-6-phosphate dehydrogenase [Actinoplanes sp. NPDC051494]|uniref:glucose-6-phosphate dehydrogenase n=1 Tax=Actinoplanes sp. NPDC051494 TaxID=3363907 RepID=UPI0037B10FC2
MDVRSDAVVLFGVTGDLVSKKLFPALYELTRRGRVPSRVIGVARSPWDHQQLVTAARKAVTEAGLDLDEAVFEDLSARMTMLSGDYAAPGTYERLAGALADAERPLFYLAIPPAVFDAVVSGLSGSGLADRGRVVVEKPFGHDLPSSHALNERLTGAFAPESIFRIDHYLGKEPIEGLSLFRFGNRVFEQLWNREHIASIQVTVAEKFGTQGRAGFYDNVGAIRDVLQNHILQVVALLAMEPPADASQEAFQAAEAEVLSQALALSPETTVRGQYEGYRDETGVKPGSQTETFVATRLTIDNDRWAGVPFLLRTGKSMPGTATEVVVEFRPPDTTVYPVAANLLRFRLGKNDGISLSAQVKTPGTEVVAQTVELNADFDSFLEPRREAYERLLDDAMDADHTRFARVAAIEQEWRIVDPILDLTTGVQEYPQGTWGPADGETWH